MVVPMVVETAAGAPCPVAVSWVRSAVTQAVMMESGSAEAAPQWMAPRELARRWDSACRRSASSTRRRARGEELGARGGEDGALAGAVNEVDAEVLLEAAQALGERGLGHVQRCRRAAEMALVGDRDEEAEVAD